MRDRTTHEDFVAHGSVEVGDGSMDVAFGTVVHVARSGRRYLRMSVARPDGTRLRDVAWVDGSEVTFKGVGDARGGYVDGRGVVDALGHVLSGSLSVWSARDRMAARPKAEATRTHAPAGLSRLAHVEARHARHVRARLDARAARDAARREARAREVEGRRAARLAATLAARAARRAERDADRADRLARAEEARRQHWARKRRAVELREAERAKPASRAILEA